eukprot:Transcript_797.p1 GENE.Transcript_797~~Transcript_797.p1  ORF type:complete len:580 (-),score=111.25 Transcript_797:99-1838(-)
MVLDMSLSINLMAPTIEKVVGKMQTGHTGMLLNMLKGLKLCAPLEVWGSAGAVVLQPLQAVLDEVAKRGHAFYNVPDLFLEATQEALKAHEEALDALADEATWPDVPALEAYADSLLKGDPTGWTNVCPDLLDKMLKIWPDAVTPAEIAGGGVTKQRYFRCRETRKAMQVMRSAAELCARHDRHKAAARLLTMAVQRCPVMAEDAAAVEKACPPWRHKPTAEQRAALEAMRLLLESGECRRAPWPLTLLALAKAAEHEWATANLAVASGLPGTVVKSRPFDEDATPKATKGSALMAASALGDGEGVVVALEAGADTNATAENNVTALMLAARAGSVSAVRALVANGANATSRSHKGCTALGLAADAGAADCATLLIEGGAEVNAASEQGLTPLHEAALGGHTAVVEVLAENGAQMDLQDKSHGSPLGYAAEQGHVAVTALLLAKGAQADLCDDKGRAPLNWASLQGHEATVAALLAGGAQVNLTSKIGIAPLFVAANGGHEAVVAVLLANGAQVNLTTVDAHTDTALSAAAGEGHEAVVEALLAKGARKDLVNKTGDTPLSMAEKHGHASVVALLTTKE